MKRANHPSDRAVAEVAWLYYVKGLNQNEIAQKLGLSRPTIITYLKIARDRKLMDVKISGVHFSVNTLADALQEEFQLDRVFVVPTEGNSHDALVQVTEVAAHYLPDFVAPGDVLGVSWGQTLSLVSERVPWWPIADLTVRQLIGSMANPVLPTSESCTTEIARRLSAHCVNLNAPAVCSDAALAQGLKSEPIIAKQLNALADCNKAIFSLSPCTFDSHLVQFQIASAEDISAYVDKGAVGIIVGRFINADGDPVMGDLDARLFGADHETLRKMSGLLVASDVSKAEATRAALRGGYVSSLVIEEALAQAVMANRLRYSQR